MSVSPRRPQKKVIINEDCNTYYEMIDDEGDLDAIAAEVKNLFDIEETSDASKECLLEDLNKLKEDNKIKGNNIELLSQKQGLQKKNIELGEIFMSELTSITNEIRNSFQSVSGYLQQRSEILLSIYEINKYVKEQTYLNNLSVEQYLSSCDKKIQNQESFIHKLNDDIDTLKNDGEQKIEHLDKRFEDFSTELSKRNVGIEEVSAELEFGEKKCSELRERLAKIKESVGETNLDLQEVNLKREEMTSDLEASEGVYKKEMKELRDKNQQLSERFVQEGVQCDNLENKIQAEKKTFEDFKNDRKQLEENNAKAVDNINQSMALLAQLNEQKNQILTTIKAEQDNKQKILSENRLKLEEEQKRKHVLLEESNQYKQQCALLKIERDDLLKTIENSTNNISKENISNQELSQENSALETTNSSLVNQITEIQQAIESLKVQNVSEINATNNTELELQNSIQEMSQKLNNIVESHKTSYDELKKQFKVEKEELEKCYEGQLVAMRKSINELRELGQECEERTKLLENNFDGVNSECDVISRKLLVLERTLIDEKRKKRGTAPASQFYNQKAKVAKKSTDAMSESSDERPTAMDILLRKREIQMRKNKAKKSTK